MVFEVQIFVLSFLVCPFCLHFLKVWVLELFFLILFVIDVKFNFEFVNVFKFVFFHLLIFFANS